MKKLIAFVLALVCVLALVGCSKTQNDNTLTTDETETVSFYDKTFNKSALSTETIEWLEWYNGLTETEQLSISYIPSDLYKLCGYGSAEDIPAETE